MTALTEAEIRAAAQHAWSARDLVDLAREAFADLATDASAALWDGDWEEAARIAGLRQDRLVDEELARVVATFEDAVVQAIATALGRFAAEYPDVPRRPARETVPA